MEYKGRVFAAAAGIFFTAAVDAATTTRCVMSPPEYPASALRSWEQGEASVLMSLAPTGEVEWVRVDRPSGNSALDEAAAAAAWKAKCAPGPAERVMWPVDYRIVTKKGPQLFP
jgi:TonB family protein